LQGLQGKKSYKVNLFLPRDFASTTCFFSTYMGNLIVSDERMKGKMKLWAFCCFKKRKGFWKTPLFFGQYLNIAYTKKWIRLKSKIFSFERSQKKHNL
jgi:hypothetical protein